MWWNWYCKAVGTAVLRIGWAGRREGSLGSRTGGWEVTALLDVVPVVQEGWEEAGGVPVSPRAGVLPSGSVARPRVSDEGWRFLPPPSLQLVTSWSGRKGFKKSSVTESAYNLDGDFTRLQTQKWERRLTLGAEAWSGPIRRIEAASFLASSVLFSSCLQRGKFLVREGLKSVWGPWTWCDHGNDR